MQDVTTVATVGQAIDALWQRSGYDRGFISNPFAGDEAARRGLQRTQALLDRAGNPERAFHVVHVAGSKGKGSTCVFIDAILRAAGVRCGRYLSPHLHSWHERFVVNDHPIADGDFVTLTRDIIHTAERVEADRPDLGQVTAFELSTAMALVWFQRSGCEMAVVEVGLGGTLDATNVVDPAVSVITPLDYEHTAILGSTMHEIAGNKAGIIKPGRPVVSAAQPAGGMRVVEQRARACDAPLQIAGRDWTVSGTDWSCTLSGPWVVLPDVQLSLAGQHQVDNAGLAVAAVHALARGNAVPETIDERAIRAGLRAARLPARFELVPAGSGQTVVIDGAHTPRATAALADTMRSRLGDTGVVTVVGMLDDKHPSEVLPPLLDCTDQWIAVSPASPRALPAREVASAVEALGAPCAAYPTVAGGLDAARATGYPHILVTGSFSTAAEARIALGLA